MTSFTSPDGDDYFSRFTGRRRQAVCEFLLEGLPELDYEAATQVYRRVGHDFSPTVSLLILPVFRILLGQLPFRDDPDEFYDRVVTFLYSERLVTRFQALPPPSPDDTVDHEAELLKTVADAYLAEARERGAL